MTKPIDLTDLRCHRCHRKITAKNTKHGKVFKIIGINNNDDFVLCDGCQIGLRLYLEKR